MTKEYAITLLRRLGLDTSIEGLYYHYPDGLELSRHVDFNKFKLIIESVSDGYFTIKRSETPPVIGGYVIDFVKSDEYYTDYWS